MSDDTTRVGNRPGRKQALPDDAKRRFVGLSDEVWNAVLRQAEAEIRLLGSAGSSPGSVVERALRLYFGMNSNSADSGATIDGRRIRRRPSPKGGDAAEGE